MLTVLRNLKRQAAALGGKTGHQLMDVLGSMSNYIWRRNDTMGGLSNSIGWLTTSASKERMLSYMKDYFERGMMTITSTELIDEMKTIILASGRNKDDRVMATALACAAYAEQLQPRLIAQKITRNVSRTQEDSTPEQIVVGRTVSDYLKRIGVYGQ